MISEALLIITLIQASPSGEHHVSFSHIHFENKKRCEQSGQMMADAQARRAQKITEGLGDASKFDVKWECI